MRQELPEHHGLDEFSISSLVHQENDRPSITDVQYEALARGVGRGESLLIVSPTSTGKTQIALWGMAHRLRDGGRVVYLVTHRALAKQKFEELRSSSLLSALDDDLSRICLATGDEVVTGDDSYPKDPLQVRILVATYEKYLALVSGAGVPGSLRDVCVVCDEVQLIGDANRGQNVEVLLTLLRQAGWAQLIALSAVLSDSDAAELADWLNVGLLVLNRREKHLRYECWMDDEMISVSTSDPGRLQRSQGGGRALNCLGVVRHLLAEASAKPIIVFCMTKSEAMGLARDLVDAGVCAEQEQLSFEFLDMPETGAVELLRNSLTRRVAVHTADLTEEERAEVERKILASQLDVVFATPTLAAGVNFPFATAVFASWKRWDQSLRMHVPIESGDFHNMAGRAGRMGFHPEEGRIIFFADRGSAGQSRRYLDLSSVERLEPRIGSRHFAQLVLQLVASGICTSRAQLTDLICHTFSGLREADRNQLGYASWPDRIECELAGLINKAFIASSFSGELSATPIGKSSAHSGFQPATTDYLLSAVVALRQQLVSFLPSLDSSGRLDLLIFSLARVCLASPEFTGGPGANQTRWLPWPLSRIYVTGVAERTRLFDHPQLSSEVPVLSSSALVADWANGASLAELEARAQSLSAGMLKDLVRNMSWMMQGLAAILDVATDPRVPLVLRPESLRIDDEELRLLRRLPRTIGRLSRRLSVGLPEEVLWLLELNARSENFRITRDDALRLLNIGLTSPTNVMAGDQAADLLRISAFPRGRPSPRAKANWLRDRARGWKSIQRSMAAEKQSRRARRCQHRDLVNQFYSAMGTQFELAFEQVVTHLGIRWQKLDGPLRVGAPDYVVWVVDAEPLVFELKTREQSRLVDYNSATEVLAASEVHGLRDAFCVTLCHPGVDPSVPGVIAACGRLSVVESHDLGDALLRLCEGDLTKDQLHRWLATPGQALAADLPYREYD